MATKSPKAEAPAKAVVSNTGKLSEPKKEGPKAVTNPKTKTTIRTF